MPSAEISGEPRVTDVLAQTGFFTGPVIDAFTSDRFDTSQREEIIKSIMTLAEPAEQRYRGRFLDATGGHISQLLQYCWCLWPSVTVASSTTH